MRSLTPNGETDNNSLHGSCPTSKGEKWSATKWIHVGPFGGSVEAAKAKWWAAFSMGALLSQGMHDRVSPKHHHMSPDNQGGAEVRSYKVHHERIHWHPWQL